MYTYICKGEKRDVDFGKIQKLLHIYIYARKLDMHI